MTANHHQSTDVPSGAEFKKIEDGQYSVAGHLNFANVRQVLSQSKSVFTRNMTVVINLSKLGNGNSAVVALIIEWIKLAKESNCDFQIKSLPSHTLSIIQSAGMQDLITPFLDK